MNRLDLARVAALSVALVPLYVPCITTRATAIESLGQRSTWEPPSVDTQVAWLTTALAELARSQGSESRDDTAELAVVLGTAESRGETLTEFCRRVAEVDPDFRALFDAAQLPHPALPLPSFPVLHDSSRPEVIRANFALLYARWLATHQFFDESLELLRDIPIETVVSPAMLLFYRAVALDHCGMSKEAAAELARLRSNAAAVPSRFLTVAELLESDWKLTAQHKLDPVARLMDRITIRLGHARAGQRVREEEDEVVRQLDDLIDQIEQQLEQSRAAMASGQGGASAPGAPMGDSAPGGAMGEGNVMPRDLGEEGGWGNLPQKERQRALQQLSKDFPSHYRDIVERYFKKLAQEERVP